MTSRTSLRAEVRGLALIVALLLLTPAAGVSQTIAFTLSASPTFVLHNGTSELLGQVTLTATSACGTSADGLCVSSGGTISLFYAGIPIVNGLGSGIQVCEVIGGSTTCNAAGTLLSGTINVFATSISIGIKAGVDVAASNSITISGVRGNIAVQCPAGCAGSSFSGQASASPTSLASFSPASATVATAFADQSAMRIVSGNGQTGTAGFPLAQPFVVSVTAPMGGPAAGVTVTFTVLSGGGTLSATNVVTGANGQASATLTLGPSPGVNTVSASAPGIPGSPLQFSANGVLNFAIASGNNQSAVIGTAVPNPLVVRITGASEAPVAGMAVKFEIVSGAAAFSTPAETTTGPDGQASVRLTLGLTTGTITIRATTPNLPDVALHFTIQAVLAEQLPAVGSGGVVNGASFRLASDPNGAAAPGTIVAIFGTNLASGTAVATALPLPTALEGTSVSFNGVLAPLFFVSPTQINAQLPFEVSSGQVTVVATRNNTASAPQVVSVAAVSPGIFTVNRDGTGPGAILHAETFQLVTASNPARPGEFLLIYCTGLGQLQSPVASGVAPPVPPPQTVATPLVTIAGIPAAVFYSGLAPGFAGLYQVNVQVPAGVPSGTQSLVLSINGVPANTVTVNIQ